ncbi:hypothetical protein B7463_g10198, partial [Scytalidium lignicola]
MTAALATSLPSGPDTKDGYTFLYVNIPLLVLATVIVGFRVWWRCVRNGGGALNKADICVVICLVFNVIQLACISSVKYSWDKTIPGKCINIKAFWYGQSGWNTFMDVVVLVLPIPVIMKLQMNRRAKLGLLAVFILGMFVCVTSIERLISLNFNATFAEDFTWATGTSVIWTQVEATVGVICACAPSLRIPLGRFIPFLFGSTKQDQSYPLSDGVYAGAGAASGNWKDQSTRSKRHGESDVETDNLETKSRGEGSEERITGIQKTVSIELTFAERRPGEENIDGSKTHERHQFDHHAV